MSIFILYSLSDCLSRSLHLYHLFLFCVPCTHLKRHRKKRKRKEKEGKHLKRRFCAFSFFAARFCAFCFSFWVLFFFFIAIFAFIFHFAFLFFFSFLWHFCFFRHFRRFHGSFCAFCASLYLINHQTFSTINSMFSTMVLYVANSSSSSMSHRSFRSLMSPTRRCAMSDRHLSSRRIDRSVLLMGGRLPRYSSLTHIICALDDVFVWHSVCLLLLFGQNFEQATGCIRSVLLLPKFPRFIGCLNLYLVSFGWRCFVDWISLVCAFPSPLRGRAGTFGVLVWRRNHSAPTPVLARDLVVYTFPCLLFCRPVLYRFLLSTNLFSSSLFKTTPIPPPATTFATTTYHHQPPHRRAFAHPIANHMPSATHVFGKILSVLTLLIPKLPRWRLTLYRWNLLAAHGLARGWWFVFPLALLWHLF